MSRIIYYYQTFCGLEKILIKNTPVTHIHVSSVHFGLDKTLEPYIHLNNESPYSDTFNHVWDDVERADKLGINIVLMIGGAGGGYFSLFSNFDLYYDLLYHLIKNKPCIKGVDLDIEEGVSLENVQKLINKIVSDFGEEFIISMAPVEGSLQHDDSGMGGFCYKTLLKSDEGKHINYLNAQCYIDYSLGAYDDIINNDYNSEMIVMGTINPSIMDVVKEVNTKYKKSFGGVFLWEYMFAEPDGYIWAQDVKDIINPSFLTKLFSYLAFWKYLLL
jgi:hypothetical protein